MLARKATRPAPDFSESEPRASDLAIWREATTKPSSHADALASRLADPLEVLEARSWARARLWAEYEIDDLLDAVDPLQEFAERTGLVAAIGQDAVQIIIGRAFAAVRQC